MLQQRDVDLDRHGHRRVDVVASSATTSTSTSSSTTTTSSSSTSTSSSSGTVDRIPISVTGTTDTRFVTADHMFAGVEMQLSGEPLAESMGRQLPGYSRDFPTPDVYFTPADTPFPGSKTNCEVDGGSWNASVSACPVPDLVGYATAVESYEYSKQPMNNLALESGAGTSFIFGPLVNPTAATGAAALAILIPRVQHYGVASNATPIFVHTVDGTDATNRFGWPGLWPTLQPYSTFDPHILPVSTVGEVCSISSDDDPNATGSILNLDYECDYNSLHLPDRDTQLTKTITPGSTGWAQWKYALWVLNYLQSMHDSNQTAITTIAAGDMSSATWAWRATPSWAPTTGPSPAPTSAPATSRASRPRS